MNHAEILDKRVTVSADVIFREVGGEGVILDLKTERYLGLNEVGARVWKCFTESDSVQSAFATLVNEYEVDAERLLSDLQALIEQLTDNGLIQVVPGSPKQEAAS